MLPDEEQVPYDEVDMGETGVVSDVTQDDVDLTSNRIDDFIKAIEKQDFTSAEKDFNDMIGDRMQTALDQAKVSVASQMYNDEEPEEVEEPESENDELDDYEDQLEAEEEEDAA